MKKPNLFIIGEPKSGTTAVYNYLDQHPDVFMSTPKEPYFFCTDVRREAENRGRIYQISSLDEYLDLFCDAEDETIIGEATPNYLFSRTAAEEIYKFDAKAKFIALFREPLDFLISSYYHRKKQGKEFANSFQEAIQLSELRKQGKKLPPREKHPSFYDLDKRISYAAHLRRYLDRFSAEQIQVIIFKNFKRDNQEVMNRIFDFLDIKTLPVQYERVNIRKEVRFYNLRRLLSSYQIKRAGKRVPDSIKHKTRKLTNTLTLKKPKEKPLDPKFKKQLKKRFKPKVVKLHELLHEYNLTNKNIIQLWEYDRI